VELLTIEMNAAEVKRLCRERVTQLINEVDAELVFWDRNELIRRTCMSWNFIQDQFFFDPRFPKKKVGAKWYFPAKATQEFLIQWLSEQ